MSTSRFALALLPFALVVASACSSSPAVSGTTEETKPLEAAPEAGTVDAADAAPPATPKKDAAPEPAPAGECSSEATQTGCVTCCSNKHEDGAAVYFIALIDCMCLADNCQKDCEKTLCDPANPQNADTACQACVQAKNSKCATPIKTTCLAAPDCVAFDTCIGKSDCAGK